MADEYTPPATQEELDAIVGARLKRERDKYADYDDLKAAAAKAAEAEAAHERELEEARGEVERLKREAAERDEAAKAADTRARVAREAGVPAELVAGEDEESMRAFAEAVAAFAKRPAAPVVPEAGRSKGAEAHRDGWSEVGEALFPKD